jgi:hypothetical protein
VNGDQYYELDQIREQEYMLEATVRRASRQRSRSRFLGLIGSAVRRRPGTAAVRR